MSHSTAPLSASLEIAICVLPELASGWDKEPIGEQMITDIATILKSGDAWQCKSHSYFSGSSAESVLGNVPKLFDGLSTLFITHKISDVLVCFTLEFI